MPSKKWSEIRLSKVPDAAAEAALEASGRALRDAVAAAQARPAAPRLTDGSVVLDGLTEGDAPAIVAAEDDAIRFAWMRSEPITLERAAAWIATAATAWEGMEGHLAWAIRTASSPELVGWLALALKPRHGALIECWIAPASRRSGLARRALALACDYGFEQLAMRWIDGEIRPENEASAALATSLGFEPSQLRQMRDGTFINAYRLLRGRWRAPL